MKGPLVISLTACLLSGAWLCACGSNAPPTAEQVARSAGLTRFTDCGPAPLGGVTDSGTGYLGSERIGVNTFPGSDIRDKWLQEARQFGVIPLTEGSTWVTYKATDQKARGCQ